MAQQLNQENIAYWKQRIELDYFTQFIKAYILFNAWYRHAFPNLKTEREILDAIKTQSTAHVRSKCLPMLTDTVEEAKQLQNALANLHQHLERYHLHNRDGQRISFTSFYLERNPNVVQQGTNNSIKFKVDATRTKANNIVTAVRVTVEKSNGDVISMTQSEYGWSDLEQKTEFQWLSPTQVTNLRFYYEAASPRRLVDLTNTQQGSVPIGSFQFCNNPAHIFAGMIEVIYDLRNLLFHGELIPSQDTNEIYGAAYAVLRELIRPIGTI
jgi:hypothetical protein